MWSRAIGYLNSDHILYPKLQVSINSLRSISLLGLCSWIFLAACLLIVSNLCVVKDYVRNVGNRYQNKTKPLMIKVKDGNAFMLSTESDKPLQSIFLQLTSFLKVFFYRFQHYFCCAALVVIYTGQSTVVYRNTHWIMLLWLYALFFLIAFLEGDMISAMTNSNRDLLVDSWDDLLERDDIKQIAVINHKSLVLPETRVQEMYLPPGKYSALARKLVILPIEHFLNDTLKQQLISDVSERNYAFTFHKVNLEKEAKFHRQANLHVSRFGGRREPYFFPLYPHSSPKIRRVINIW